MKIIVENSSWSNVGNAWFQTSLYLLLKNTFPQHEVVMGSTPMAQSFRVSGRFYNNTFDIVSSQKADLHIFSGPMIGEFRKDSVYKKAVVEFLSRGESYAFISASSAGLNKEGVSAVRAFFKEYPPVFLFSRDEATYNNFKDVVASYNGVCTAFFIKKTIPMSELLIKEPYFISSFYTELEPTYYVENGKNISIENIMIEHHKSFLPYRISRHFNFLRRQQKEVCGYKIVRTIQNLNTRFNHINFAMPNSFIDYNPLMYLDVTNSSQFVISDRVHACVTGLACGKPVKFLFNTVRAGVFDRMGFDYKKNGGIMYPNMSKIDEEYIKLISKLKEFLS